MTERRPGGHGDDHHLPEQFLVDGVAPSVIGEGPPELPSEVTPDFEPPGRHQPPRQPPAHAPRGPGTGYGGQPGYHPIEQEPPTSPIPAQSLEPKKRSWLGRMFRP